MSRELRTGERIRFGAAEPEIPDWARPLLALPEAVAKLSETLAKLEGTAAELAGEEADEEESESHLYAPEPEPINQAEAEMRQHRALRESEHRDYQERQRRLSDLWESVGAPAPAVVYDKAKLGWRE
jgi:hypothetical protein